MDIPPWPGGGHVPHILPDPDAGIRHMSVDVPPWSRGGHVPHILPHPDAGVRHVSMDFPPWPGGGHSRSTDPSGNTRLCPKDLRGGRAALLLGGGALWGVRATRAQRHLSVLLRLLPPAARAASCSLERPCGTWGGHSGPQDGSEVILLWPNRHQVPCCGRSHGRQVGADGLQRLLQDGGCPAKPRLSPLGRGQEVSEAEAHGEWPRLLCLPPQQACPGPCTIGLGSWRLERLQREHTLPMRASRGCLPRLLSPGVTAAASVAGHRAQKGGLVPCP